MQREWAAAKCTLIMMSIVIVKQVEEKERSSDKRYSLAQIRMLQINHFENVRSRIPRKNRDLLQILKSNDAKNSVTMRMLVEKRWRKITTVEDHRKVGDEGIVYGETFS